MGKVKNFLVPRAPESDPGPTPEAFGPEQAPTFQLAPKPSPEPVREEPAYLAPRALSPAQRAAQTRAANKANGTTGTTGTTSTKGNGSSPQAGQRAAGVLLEFWVTAKESEIALSFKPVREDGSAWRFGLGEGERGLPDIRWHAYHDSTSDRELFGFDTAELSVYRAGENQVERALPLMKRANRLITQAREESEDMSIGFVASTLASHFRASCVKFQAPDGTVTEHKRGAAYVIALRAGEALRASLPAPAPEPEPEQAPETLAAE